jgi:hypothetical protein
MMVLRDHAMEEVKRKRKEKNTTGCQVQYKDKSGPDAGKVAAIRSRAIDQCAYMAPCCSAIASLRTEKGGQIRQDQNYR